MKRTLTSAEVNLISLSLGIAADKFDSYVKDRLINNQLIDVFRNQSNQARKLAQELMYADEVKLSG